jgi:hypothetical protein
LPGTARRRLAESGHGTPAPGQLDLNLAAGSPR